MKNFVLFTLITLLFFSCNKNDEPEPNSSDCFPKTPFYGKLKLSFYSLNPLENIGLRPYQEEYLCWNDSYPFQVSSGGSQGYGTFEFSMTEIKLTDYDTLSGQFSANRYIIIGYTDSIEAHSTQEKFYDLLTLNRYTIASSNVYHGNFFIKYFDFEQRFTSQSVDDSKFQVQVSEVEKLKPEFVGIPTINNGIPASVTAKLNFSCLLKSRDNKYLLIEDAEVRGRFFRQNNKGAMWDDWGKD